MKVMGIHCTLLSTFLNVLTDFHSALAPILSTLENASARLGL